MGDCPYEGCAGHVWVVEADDFASAYFVPHDCETCGQRIWTLVSRWNPESWTDEAFHEEFVVDEATKHITPRNPPEPVSEAERLLRDAFMEELERTFLYGRSPND